MGKKNKAIEVVSMSCPVCTECYREIRPGYSEDRCHFGGPFIGYTKIKLENNILNVSNNVD